MFSVELWVTVTAWVSEVVLLPQALFLFCLYFILSLAELAQMWIRLRVVGLIRVQYNVLTILVDLVVPLVLLNEIFSISGWAISNFKSLSLG